MAEFVQAGNALISIVQLTGSPAAGLLNQGVWTARTTMVFSAGRVQESLMVSMAATWAHRIRRVLSGLVAG